MPRADAPKLGGVGTDLGSSCTRSWLRHRSHTSDAAIGITVTQFRPPMACSGLPADRNQGAQLRVAQVEAPPHEDTEIDAEQHGAEQGVLDPHLAGDRAAEIAGEQYRSQNRCARNRVE